MSSDIRKKFLERATDFGELVEVDGGAFVRPMSKGVKSRLEAMVSKVKDKPTGKGCSDIRWLALVNCLCDEMGEPILEAGDRDGFDKWNDAVVEPIFEKILEISKVTEEDKEEFLGN